MIHTTLNRIRKDAPLFGVWPTLLAYVGKTEADDEPLPFSTIVAAIGLDDAIWCCRAEAQYAQEWRLYAVWCVRRVQHLLTDPRALDALDVAERYAHGGATSEELMHASLAADDAEWESDEEGPCEWAYRAVCTLTTWASYSAMDAVYAARQALGAAEEAAQIAEFLRVVTETPTRPQD